MAKIAGKSASYIRNVMRSFGYTTIDILKDRTPFISNLVKESKETTTDIYRSIKEFSSGKNLDIKSTGKEALDNIWKNIKDDLKTGNYYNKERDEVMDQNLAKMIGFDVDFEDFDFSFDDNDISLGDPNDDISDGDELIVKQNAKNTAAAIMAVDRIGGKVTAGVAKSNAASANYIVASNKTMNKAIMNLTSKGFATVTDAIAQLNKNTIGLVESIAQPLTTFMQNGTLFFGKTTEALDKLVKNSEELLKRVPQYSGNTSSTANKANGLDNVMAGGEFSVSAYKDMVTANIKETMSLITSITGMKSKDFKMSDLAKGWSPLRTPLKMVMSAVIPAALTTSLQAFDESLKNTIPSLIARAMSKNSNSLIGSILKGIFLPKENWQRDIGTNYNQGPIPFDGQTKKAITEVIPTYLSNILHAISGTENTVYDYSKGVFVKKSEVSTAKKAREIKAAREAAGTFYEDAITKAGNNSKVKGEIDAFFLEAFLNGDTTITDLNRAGFENTPLGKLLSKETLTLLRSLREANKGKYNRIPANIMLGRAQYSNNIRTLQNSGTSIDVALGNRSNILNAGNAGLLGIKDDYGNSAIDYLRGIYYNTMGGTTSSSASSSRRRGGRSRISAPAGFSLPNMSRASESSNPEADIANTAGTKYDIDVTDDAAVKAWNDKVKARIKQITREINIIKRKKRRTEADNANLSRLERELAEATDELIVKSEQEQRILSQFLQTETTVTDRIKESRSATSERINRFLKNTIPAPVVDFFKRPIESFSDFLDKMTDSMNTFLWGDGTEAGVFDLVKKKISDYIDNNKTISKFLDNLLGEKEQDPNDPNRFVRKGLWRETKDSLKEYWNWLKAGFNEVPGIAEVDQAYNGRKITKSGVIAVSEGEMVIPAEFNPFYRKAINKGKQRRDEKNALRRFYGSFADGTPVLYDSDDMYRFYPNPAYMEAKFNEDRDSALDTMLQASRNKSRGMVKFKGKKYFKHPDGSWKTFEPGSIRDSAGSLMRDTRNLVSSGIHDIAEHYGLGGKREDLDKLLDSLGPDIKAARGRIGAGAIVGTLGGGILGSPILGMMLGSAVGFVTKSEKAQKYLFGDVDEEGNRTGGLFSKNVSNFLTKMAPEMGRGGSIGALAGGLLVGGPLGLVGGLVTGTAIGYARKSQKAQEFLFGKFDKDGNIIKKGLLDKNKLKAAMPKAMLGAIGGLVFGGAGGLFTNMVLGAGIGLLTTNKKVHDFLFGDKETKKPGLLFKIGDTLFGGINDLFHNTKNWVQTTLTNVGKNILTRTHNLFDWIAKRRAKKRALNEGVELTTGRKIARGIGKGLKYSGLGVAGLAALPFLAPFLPALGLAGTTIVAPKAFNRVRANRNARRGYNVYDYLRDENGVIMRDENGRKMKGNLSAAQRVAYRKKHVTTKEFGPGSKVTGERWDLYDKRLADASVEDLKKIQSDLADADSSREAKQIRRQGLTSFYNMADSNINSAQMGKITDLISSGATDQEIEDYINKIIPDGVDENGQPVDKSDIRDKYIKEIQKDSLAVRQNRLKSEQAKNMLLTQYGFKGGLKDITKMQDLVNTELKARTPEEIAEEKEKKEEEFKDGTRLYQETMKDKTDTVIDILRDIRDGKTGGEVSEEQKEDEATVDNLDNQAAASTANSEEVKRDESTVNNIENTSTTNTRSGDTHLSALAREATSGINIFRDENRRPVHEWDAPRPGESNTRYYNHEGDMLKYVWNGRKWEPDSRDADTKRELSDEDQEENANIKTPGILKSGFEKLAGLFGKKDKSEEKKESFLSKIGTLLLGSGGLLGKAKDLLGGLFGGITSKIGSVLGLLGKSGILGGLAGIAGNLLSGALFTNIAMVIAKAFGAGDDAVDAIKQHGSILTGAKLVSKIPVFGPLAAATMIGGDLLTGFAGSAHDELDADLGDKEKGDTNDNRADSGSGTEIKIPEYSASGEQKSVKMVFKSVAEWVSYCASNSDAMRYYKKMPNALSVTVKDSGGNNLGVVNGYSLVIPSKLCTDLNYASCVFRGNKCFYFVTKDPEAIKHFTPKADQSGFLQRNVLINVVVHTEDGRIITGSTWGSTTAYNIAGDNTVWAHSYVAIDPKTGASEKTDYTKETVLHYILEAGGFTSNTIEERYNVGPHSIMRGITEKLGKMNGYFGVESGAPIGGPVTRIDPITNEKVTADTYEDLVKKMQSENPNNKTNAVTTDIDLDEYDNSKLRSGSNVDYSGLYSDIDTKFVDPNTKKVDYSAWAQDAADRLRRAQEMGDTKSIESIKAEINYIQEKYDESKLGVFGKTQKYFDNLKKQAEELAGKGSGLAGKGGFVSQLDPRYAGKKYGTTNVADAGCAPAVASMAASALGKNLSMNSAMSTGNRYANDEGTDSDYFGDVLSSKGIDTSYVGANSAVDSLVNQKPVIMLGQDASNTSKANSPFGPNPHYVLGRGLDNQGNVIIDDPEMNKPTKYKLNKVLSSLKAAIKTGKGTGLRGKASETYSRSDTKDTVYSWLVSHGYSPATAAGIMGNIQQETGFKYGSDSYDGHYPSIGLFQWERYTGSDSGATSRAKELIDFAKQNGTTWQDINAQLGFMDKEVNTKSMANWLDPKNSTDPDIQKAQRGDYTNSKGNWVSKSSTPFARSGFDYNKDGVSLEQFKNLSDPQLAARYFHAAFERSGDLWGSSGMNRRINSAQAYYNIYSGLSELNTGDTKRTVSKFIHTGSNRKVIKNTKCRVVSCEVNRFREKDKYQTKIEENYNSTGHKESTVMFFPNDVSGQTFYHNIVKDLYTGELLEEWARKQATIGKVKVLKAYIKVGATDPHGPGYDVYDLQYSDGHVYECKYKSGIKKVEFLHSEGKYYITFADGSHEKSSSAPSQEDYPESISTFNPNDTSITDYMTDYSGEAEAEEPTGTILERVMNILSTSFNAAMSGENVEEALSGIHKHTSGGTYFGTDTDSSSSTYSGSYPTAADFNGAEDPYLDQKLELVKNALNQEKKEIYNQDYREQTNSKGEKYSDCSSFAKRMYKNTFGIDIGGNTEAQWTGAKKGTSPMTLIDFNTNNRPSASLLRPGDLIYWGNNKSRPDNVGHVEIYAGNNKLIGQDAGTGNYGPRVKNYDTYRQDRSINYIGTTRLMGTGSGLPTGKGTGIIRTLRNFVPKKNKPLSSSQVAKINEVYGSPVVGLTQYGQGSELDSYYTNLISTPANERNNNIRETYNSHRTNNIIVTSGKGSKNDNLLEQLVGAILEILTKMIDNSNETNTNVAAIKANSENLATMTELLSQYKQVKAQRSSSVSGYENETEIDDSFRSVVDKMAALAKG